jgi:hypothetical protein
MAGYSGTPLVQKLGIKAGMRVYLEGAPQGYTSTLRGMPTVVMSKNLRAPLDFIQFFVTDRSELERRFPALVAALGTDGMLWVSWPKKAARVPTDVTEDVVRDVALEGGLVDVKVCAVDAVWSGLKLVRRLKDRS